MFDIGWSELLIVAMVAVVVVGPKDLPRMLRTFGQAVGKMRRMARDFQKQFNDALREAELDDVRKDIEGVRKVDPLREVRKEARAVKDGIEGKGSSRVPQSHKHESHKYEMTGKSPAHAGGGERAAGKAHSAGGAPAEGAPEAAPAESAEGKAPGEPAGPESARAASSDEDAAGPPPSRRTAS